METTSVTVENLNDLIEIHNDRITGYEKALNDLKEEDTELRELFTNCIGESHQFKMELGTEVQSLGGEIETGTTISGKIYRVWMSVKDALGSSNQSVLESCEFGEDAAQKAYKMVLEDDSLPTYLREILTRQQSVLKAAHDKVKALRDMNK
ncbi:PA2169 family four-helix-bundle protein [Mucilaginibacter boryungensis]|uniref:PA2169 family four-helix-bundle protein n=1 Tax=Mucilaginibacter boryungensis TaxID=768480 RepID=A0ABR9XJ78_9SPHI|nr:PA2169 family four-helix-bundle protein [Mucilaginibacter boryungensis]MBE9667119.1 PA2169 family four-helix-bundle protein [Mucilaginibacter boryungensis]